MGAEPIVDVEAGEAVVPRRLHVATFAIVVMTFVAMVIGAFVLHEPADELQVRRPEPTPSAEVRQRIAATCRAVAEELAAPGPIVETAAAYAVRAQLRLSAFDGALDDLGGIAPGPDDEAAMAAVEGRLGAAAAAARRAMVLAGDGDPLNAAAAWRDSGRIASSVC